MGEAAWATWNGAAAAGVCLAREAALDANIHPPHNLHRAGRKVMAGISSQINY
jgi:hypothetical protein